MHYDQTAFWRPLFETNITMLQVATGCSHNQCHFCDMYHVPFKPSPMDEIKQDIDEIARYYKVQPARLFLTGGNALCLPASMLKEVLAYAAEKLPDTKSVGCFARITDVARKTDDDLRALKDAGLELLSIGAEGGMDDALAQQGKGFSSKDIVEQCSRLDAVGIEYALFYLAGMAGKGRGIENARATSEVFGQVNPRLIMVHTMCAFEGTQLAQDIAEGAFEPASEKEIQQELREFYAIYPKETAILAAHHSNTIPFNGRIPQDREQILALMDERIARDDEKALTYQRSQLRSI